MRHFTLLITFLGLATATVSMTAQAAYYHHRHHHYWHHGGGGSYWNYYRTSWPGAVIMRSQLVKRCALFPTYRPQSPSASRLIAANTAPVLTVSQRRLSRHPEKN